MSRSRLLVALAAGALSVSVAAPAALADERPEGRDRGRDLPAAYVLEGEQVFPEGVAYDGRSLYASSVADGTIYRGPVRGSSLQPFLPAGRDGRTTAVGLTVTRDRLVVAGGGTGFAWVYDTRTGALVARLEVPDNAPGTTFVNDVTIARDGSAYLTDSLRSVLYRIDAREIRGSRADEDGLLDVAFDTSAAPLSTAPGTFNANGIVSTPDGRGLLVVYSESGILYRIDLRTGEVVPVDLGGATLPQGDGLIRDGSTLYVIQNFANTITPVDLTRSGRTGTVGTGFSYAGADVPTTGVLVRDQLVVTNSQFDTLFAGAPLTSEVFTLSTVDLPERRRG